MMDVITSIMPWIQYPATVLTVGGFFFLGSTYAKTRQVGFVMCLIGNIVWMIYGSMPLQIGLIVTNLAIFMLAIRGYLNNAYGIDAKLLKYMKDLGLISEEQK